MSTEELNGVRGDVEKAIAAKRCADFLSELLNEAKKQTGVGYRGIMTAFDATNFSWGPAGGHGAQASGSVEKGTAGAEIRPREIPGYLANNADYVSTQRAIMAMDFLAETLHHVGLNETYSDVVYANALNAIYVGKGLDTAKTFSYRTHAEVSRASLYWHNEVNSVCQMKMK